MLKILWEKYRKIIISAASIAFVVTGSLFGAFRYFLDDISKVGIENTSIILIALQWVIPILIFPTLFIFIFSIRVFHMIHKNLASTESFSENKETEPLAEDTELCVEIAENTDPCAKKFALAFVDFIEILRKRGTNNKQIIALRNNLSRTLYVLECYKEMVRLGASTLDAASVIGDNETKIEVLIDELGWCNFLLSNNEEAVRHVDGAFDAYNSLKEGGRELSLRIKLAYLKGLRHLAIINAKNNYSQSEIYLNEVLESLKTLEEKESQQVQVDIAQVYHAKAQIIAINLNIDKDENTANGEAGKDEVYKAIDFVKKAYDIFKRIDDTDRSLKSILLHYRLLESIGDKIGCKLLQGIIEDLSNKSIWITKDIKT